MNLCLAYEHINEKESMTTKLYGHTASKILDIFYTDFFFIRKRIFTRKNIQKNWYFLFRKQLV